MKQYLIDTLTPLGYSVLLEDTLAPKEYPDAFIAFWNFDSSNRSFSNVDEVTEWGFNIRFYSKSPNEVEIARKNILKALKGAGFIPDGCGNDFTFNADTLHLGWSVDAYILEENKDG